MPTWKLTIEYKGTRYSGWQEQKNARTVAGVIREAAIGVFGDSVELGGAGRTDAGVHALGQVAHLRTPLGRSVTPEGLLISLNDRLPADVNIIHIESAKAGFHARRDATRRYYLYQISQRRTAFAKEHVWWVKDRLAFEPMAQAARTLTGRHDFKLFCDRRSEDKSTIVVVDRADFKIDQDLLLFRIGASHFLWKMVRRIVGVLVEVGRLKMDPGVFGQLILDPSVSRSNRTSQAGFDIAKHTAPPSGLFLERVCYDKAADPGPLVPAFQVRH